MRTTSGNTLIARTGPTALARSAIEMATKGRWTDALDLNRQILERDPADCAAWNRMAKALVQLGRYSGARDAFSETLRLDPANGIARKNLEKLEGLSEDGPVCQAVTAEMSPQQFIEDTGKSSVTDLVKLGDPETLKRLVSGQSVELRIQDGKLSVDTLNGDYIGQVEPKLAFRLSELVRGGNKYQGAITSAREGHVKVMLRETLVAPDQVGKRSFPSKSADGFRPYLKSRAGLLHESEASPDWQKDDDDLESHQAWNKDYEGPDEDPLDTNVPHGIRILDDQKDSLEEEEDEE